MLTRYERIIADYKNWYPRLYSQTVECRPSGRDTILVTLKDGSKMEFNSFDHTIRNVTKFYIRESVENINEEIWRKEFGHKLQKMIINSGMTQDQLSERTGISRQMISRYIRGHSTPSGYMLSRLVEVLNCDARELTKFGYIDE